MLYNGCKSDPSLLLTVYSFSTDIVTSFSSISPSVHQHRTIVTVRARVRYGFCCCGAYPGAGCACTTPGCCTTTAGCTPCGCCTTTCTPPATAAGAEGPQQTLQQAQIVSVSTRAKRAIAVSVISPIMSQNSVSASSCLRSASPSYVKTTFYLTAI